jgi:hypothetical protein
MFRPLLLLLLPFLLRSRQAITRILRISKIPVSDVCVMQELTYEAPATWSSKTT